MIAASEPLEFVPHGRTVLEKHPGKIYSKGHNTSLSEHSLLYKLTNVAIKDESLLDAKDGEDKEWWSVREFYSRKGEDFDEETTPQKEGKEDTNMSDSFRPPSRLKNDFNISIKSEIMAGMKKMEADTNPGPSRSSSANSSSNMSKKFNLNANKSPEKERSLNPRTDHCYEEELYFKGCTAVWSKGLISTPGTKISPPETRETVSCYTIDNPIKHAAFCNFHVSMNNTMLIDALNSQIGDVKQNIKIEDTMEHLQTEIMPSILLIDNKCLKVYAKDGREYVTSIPFQVKKVWPMKYGVLFEKDASPLLHNTLLPTSFIRLNESQSSTFSKSRRDYQFNMSAKLRQESLSAYEADVPLPTCFSMSHPLDEVTPLLMRSPAQGLQYYNDGDLQIIFVSTRPSIILIYDWKLCTHSLWSIRKALREECLSMCPNMNSTTVFSQSCDFGSPMDSHAKNATSWATGLGSPFTSRRIGTPNSKINSPMAAMFHQQGMSPHGSIGQASSASMMANTIQQTPPSLPLYPDICLDHIWTDSQSIRRDPIESPNDMKSFLHTDLVGHNFLCFMVKVGGLSRLQIVRLQHSHGQKSKGNIIVGSVSTVPAKDAVVLEHLNMMALIDESGNIILQSGNNFVGKVHVGGVLARLIASPYSKPAPFPRRSSLLPSRHDMSALEDPALHLLSPVPHTSMGSRVDGREGKGLQGLRDAAANRLTLIYDKGQMYRITLPEISSSTLVNKCCAAMKVILPKDISMQVIIKWYGTRNAPGTQDLTPEQEWSMFSNLLYSLIGYDLERLSLPKQCDDHGDSTEVATKKQRTSSDGTHDDWEYLLNSKMHKSYGNTLANLLNFTQTNKADSKPQKNRKKSQVDEKSIQFNSSSLLFQFTPQLLFAFHLLYEEIKLNTLLLNDLKPLSAFLYQLSKDLNLDKYVTHYWLDYPTDLHLEYDSSDSQISESSLKKLVQPSYFTSEPPNFFAYVNSILRNVDVGYYPHLADVNTMSKDLIEISQSVCGGCGGVSLVAGRAGGHSTPRGPPLGTKDLLIDRGMSMSAVESLPAGLGALVLGALTAARTDSTDMYDLPFKVLGQETAYTRNNMPDVEVSPGKADDKEETSTGMEHLDTKLLRLLYPTDHRMSEVTNLLQSSIPVSINLTQRPEVSDHDFIEEQEKYLYSVSARTMALPVARGMVTLRSQPCMPSEPISVPKLCISGRGPPPRHTAIELGADSAHCLTWPAFHNGAAAGLALLPHHTEQIHSSWVVYNKPKGAIEMSNEHAGFLLALGLNGHLKDMPYMNIYEYLVKCQEIISIGLLLGSAATYRGTMNIQATKMMSIHLEPLSSGALDLELTAGVLAAALLALGLLHQGTSHHHYTTVLLNEIGKPPGAEQEQSPEREGYALAAGLALGLVGAGGGRHGNVPHHVTHTLRTYVMGGDRPNAHGYQKDKTKQGSFAIREGRTVNLDVTSPGATLALGLIYFASGNTAVASWFKPPDTSYLLDYVRPDLLMLRCIARGLILWNEIEADEQWVESQVPPTIRPYCFVKPVEDNIDYEAMNQAYCNIVAGACFTLGLRFAGSGHEDARDTLLHYANMFITIAGKRVGELAGRSTLETCLCVCLLAAGMVMCGRGDVSVLRVCRRGRGRPGTLPHGPQMAVHCAIGLLFLGAGRCTLSTTPTAIGALLAAFFPKFPTHSDDNRYHLQAFRHLYVLAVEERLFLPRDINTGKLCYAHLEVVDLSGVSTELRAPCLLPELNTLREIRVKETRYWPLTFTRDRNWDQLQEYLSQTQCIDIKPRAGYLSYVDDPQGFQTILAQTLTLDKANIWSATPENIQLFTSDEKVRSFIKHYLQCLADDDADFGPNICPDCLVLDKKKTKRVRNETFDSKQCQCRNYSKEEMEFAQSLSMVAYECVVRDVLCALPVWTTFLKILKEMKTNPTTYHIWQIKLLLSQLEYYARKSQNDMKIDGQDTQNEPLISSEFTLAIAQKVGDIFDTNESKITPFLRKYLGLPSSRKINTCEDNVKRILSSFLVYYDIPKRILWGAKSENPLSLMLELDSNVNVSCLNKIETLL